MELTRQVESELSSMSSVSDRASDDPKHPKKLKI